MIFFLICADEEVGRRECRERGWTQTNVNRFYTPERNDVRVVRRWSTDFALLPGGTWFMAGPDFHLNPNAEDFVALVTGGQAKWIPREEPKEMPELIPIETNPPSKVLQEAEQMATEMMQQATGIPQINEPAMDRETIRERFREELLRRGQSSGTRPGRPPLER